MTKYHLVVSDKLNIAQRRKDSAVGDAPRHFFIALADALEGTLYEPDFENKTPAKQSLFHKILNTPPHLIALADRITQKCADDDVIFCISEAISLALAYALKKAGKKTKLASFGHNLYRPRITVANLIWGCLGRVDRFLVFTQEAAARSPKNRIYVEQTDDALFSPGPSTPSPNPRPVIISIGLEKRDNLTLADATKDMDVDVRITAFSRDAAPDAKAQPDPLPANMTAKFYPWGELVDLYRSCDLVAVPVVPTNYAAGITSVLEGAAVGKPIVATSNPSLMGAVADHDIAAWVPPEDVATLKQTITALLADPARLKQMGETAHRIQSQHHSFAGRIAFVSAELQSLR